MVPSSKFINDHKFHWPRKGLCSNLIQQAIRRNKLGGFGVPKFTTVRLSRSKSKLFKSIFNSSITRNGQVY